MYSLVWSGLVAKHMISFRGEERSNELGKIAFCGGLAAVLLTIALIRAVFMVPDFDFGFGTFSFIFFGRA